MSGDCPPALGPATPAFARSCAASPYPRIDTSMRVGDAARDRTAPPSSYSVLPCSFFSFSAASLASLFFLTSQLYPKWSGDPHS